MSSEPLRSSTLGCRPFIMRRSLWTGFIRSSETFPERPALRAQGEILTYRELRELACRIAATIQLHPQYSATPLTAVFAYRSPVAFAGVLGSLLAGNGYVPLNNTFPLERTRAMLDRSECRSIVVDAESLPQLQAILAGIQTPLLILVPEVEETGTLQEQWPAHRFVGARDFEAPDAWREPAISDDSIAYLLFTSGSTGTPKGVVVAQRNVISFVDYMVERYQITENDRLSQTFDMTFDLSAFDMFVCWERGALLCCPSRKALINPAKFLRDMELTVWFSVPSTIAFMKQLGALKRSNYPSLRLSLFCGEPLPVSSAQAWLDAAPNSILENLYGPTELTIACTLYRWNATSSSRESELGIVPIGHPYPGMSVLVADQNLNEVPPGGEGELLMTGPQMSLGYWKDPAKTAAAFVIPPGKTDIYYRTGDRVRRPMGDAPLTHLGRMDFQVKILGHRVELGEIEAIVRDATGLDGTVAVGWPPTPSGYGGVEVFVEGTASDPEAVRRSVTSRLPDYMVPRRFHFMGQLPRNVNGKFDRKAILNLLEGGL
jgi:amino acid adenylation domain-containing protein